jgi:hypothetical protein
MDRIKCCVLALFCTVATATAATYYVAPNGSDTKSKSQARNITTPWKTIQHGAKQLGAGDTLYVRTGTYAEMITLATSGTSTARVTVAGYPGERPVIDGHNSLPPGNLGDAQYGRVI